MSTTLTWENVRAAALDDLEDLGPSYVYEPLERNGYGHPGCYYADSYGNPSCFVGRVINRIDPELFAAIRAAETLKGRSADVFDIAQDYHVPLSVEDPDLLTALAEAQRIQDLGARLEDVAKTVGAGE